MYRPHYYGEFLPVKMLQHKAQVWPSKRAYGNLALLKKEAFVERGQVRLLCEDEGRKGFKVQDVTLE